MCNNENNVIMMLYEYLNYDFWTQNKIKPIFGKKIQKNIQEQRVETKVSVDRYSLKKHDSVLIS